METLVYTFSFFILFAVTIPVFARKKELLKTAVNVKAISCLQPALGYLQMLTPFPKRLHAPFVKPDSSRLRDRCSPWRCSVAGAGQNRGPAALPSTLCGEPQHVSPGPGCAAEASVAARGGAARRGCGLLPQAAFTSQLPLLTIPVRRRHPRKPELGPVRDGASCPA